MNELACECVKNINHDQNKSNQILVLLRKSREEKIFLRKSFLVNQKFFIRERKL
jgi:hypothetical protein